MKKAKQAVVADEPVGIVIAMGSRGRVQAAPLVRAYYWYTADESAATLADERVSI
jgi:hypothetical protein